MDIIRGLKPLTEIERAVAAEVHRRLRPEIELVRTMNPELLVYVQPFNAEMATSTQKLRYYSENRRQGPRAQQRRMPPTPGHLIPLVLDPEQESRRVLYFQPGRVLAE
ncbi:hypothetical protein [Mesorhizobium sp.]|uniref:hypothetical protein n=1 Tax=Mesorhizobium sp. TaxID=1871066 RepID=UPI000FE4A60F|nr:hypothetical protein [Mesorhizobium sp.]RWE44212.1 MAG: hypothetical protein EOS80_19930 [Mesorhizobium sp.]